jgi:hypothetical protein
MAQVIKVIFTKKVKIDANTIKHWCKERDRVDGDKQTVLFASINHESDLFDSKNNEHLRFILEEIAESDEQFIDEDVSFEIY